MTLRQAPAEIIEESTSPLVQIADWWQRCELGQVAEVTNGAAFKSTLFNKNGDGLPLIRIRDVGKTETSVHYIGDYDPRHIVERGDLLVGMDGDFRVARWNGDHALLNQRVCRLRILDESQYSGRLLEFVLQPYLDEIHKVTSSVTVKHLSSRTVQRLPIPLPPRAEQDRIVVAIEEQFSRLDALEDSVASARSKSIALGVAHIRSAMQGWPRVRLGDVSEVFVGSTPSRRNSTFWGGTVPWVSSGEIQFCRIRDTRESVSTVAVRPERIHPRGTVLLAMIGEGRTRGQAAILEVAAAHNQNSAAIRTEPSKLDPEWLFYVLSDQYKSNRRVGSGNNQPALNKARVQGLRVPVPPIDDQHRLVTQLDEVATSLDQVNIGLEEARQRSGALRRAVLARAFAGQLVPQ